MSNVLSFHVFENSFRHPARKEVGMSIQFKEGVVSGEAKVVKGREFGIQV